MNIHHNPAEFLFLFQEIIYNIAEGAFNNPLIRLIIKEFIE